MNFSRVDRTLKAWAGRNHVALSTQHQDVDVRSIDLAGPDGRAHIWIEVNGPVEVHVWDYRKRRRVFLTEETALAGALDEALRTAKAWCGIP
jgi:hypothetical protein